MKKLSANVCAVTHAGRVRKENEDNYSLNGRLTSTGDLKKGSAYVQKMSEPFHLAVCDGMGGEEFGEIASGIAVDSISKSASNIYSSGEDFNFAISSAVDDANSKICREIQTRGKRMGTTLAAVYAVKGKAICVSIGDTRIYHFSNGILKQMSFDHTHAQQFVDMGGAPMSDINTIPDAKRLTKHLGVFPEESTLTPSVSVIDDVENGDVILLCSDGLTDMLTDDEISLIISGGENAQDVTGKLIRKALERGGKDNVTVVTAFMSAEDTAIFVPIAEAMVGNQGANYEEEYRNSYGANVPYGYENSDSPYANADASAADEPVDVMKWIKIGAIVLVSIIVIVAGAFIVKGAIDNGKKDKGDEESSSSETTTAPTTTAYEVNTELQTTEPTETESTETESETESTTESTTSTTRYYSTTRKRTSTTTRRSTAASTSNTTSSASSSVSTTDPLSNSAVTGESTGGSTASTTGAGESSSSGAAENTTASTTAIADPSLNTTATPSADTPATTPSAASGT